MLKCEELMQQEVVKMTTNKTYRLNHYDDLKRVIGFSFMRHLNNTLGETDITISVVRYDYVLLYTVLAKRQMRKIKLVDFAVSIDLDETNDTFTVTDCYATYWPEKKDID
jgi:hypothetical protein